MKRSASFTLGSCVTRGEGEEEGKREGGSEEEGEDFIDISFCSCD
jgi:hypothetical protein